MPVVTFLRWVYTLQPVTVICSCFTAGPGELWGTFGHQCEGVPSKLCGSSGGVHTARLCPPGNQSWVYSNACSTPEVQCADFNKKPAIVFSFISFPQYPYSLPPLQSLIWSTQCWIWFPCCRWSSWCVLSVWRTQRSSKLRWITDPAGRLTTRCCGCGPRVQVEEDMVECCTGHCWKNY